MTGARFRTGVHSLAREVPKRALAIAILGALLFAANLMPDTSWIDHDRMALALSVILGLTATAMAIADRMSAASLASLAAGLLVATMASAGSLVAAEFVTRRVFADVTTTGDGGGYFANRWRQSGAVTRNSAGFRDREFSPLKRPGVYRIVVVGDSFTFGNGIPQADRYSDLLQSSSPESVEVLNFGVPGDNTSNHVRALENQVLPTAPDFVLLQWYVNDVEGNDSSGRPVYRPLVPVPALHDWLQSRSALYSLLGMEWVTLQVSMGMERSYADYLFARAGDPESADARREAEELGEFFAVSKKHGAQVGMVLFPDSGHDLGETYPYGYLHDRVLEVCRQAAVTCIDLRRDFAVVRNRRLLWASRFDAHPSALANSIAAARIRETFGAAWLTPPPR